MNTRSIRFLLGALPLVVASTGCASTGSETTSARATRAPELRVSPAAAPATKPAPPKTGDDEPGLTGDWGGTRTNLEEQGLTLEADIVAIGQAILGDGGFPGADDDEIQVTGDFIATLDTSRMGLWEGGSLKIRGEGRAGDSVVGAAGTVSPINIRAAIPPARFDDEMFAVTEVAYTHTIDERTSLHAGLLQNLDLDQNPFASGRGIEQFMNLALVISPVIFRGAPYSALGAGAIFEPNDTVKVRATVMNAEESSNKNPFSNDNGTALVSEVYLSYDFSGLPGGDTFGLVWAEGDFPALDDDLPIILPPGTPAQNDEHTWALYYNFYQYLTVLDESDPDRGWGIFGRLNLADDETNPIQWMASFGLGGQGLFPDRPDDRFGLGYFYLGLADDPIINDLTPPGAEDEQGLELFYDFALTNYLRVAPDLQFINNGIRGAQDSWVVALRAYLAL